MEENAIVNTEEQKKKNSVFKSTLFFWLCVLFGPFAIFLLSYFSHAVMGFHEGIIFEITMFIAALAAQPASCFFGYSIAYHYSPTGNCAMINGIVCIALFAFTSCNSLMYADYAQALSLILGIVAIAFCILKKDDVPDFFG